MTGSALTPAAGNVSGLRKEDELVSHTRGQLVEQLKAAAEKGAAEARKANTRERKQALDVANEAHTAELARLAKLHADAVAVAHSHGFRGGALLVSVPALLVGAALALGGVLVLQQASFAAATTAAREGMMTGAATRAVNPPQICLPGQRQLDDGTPCLHTHAPGEP